MKSTKWLGVLGALSLAMAPATFAATTIGVNFQGRTSTGSNPATTPLAAGDSAGVVPQANWNNVDDAYGAGLATFVGANKGTTAALMDGTGAATTVTLTFAANDSWNNDVDPATITTGNAKMMNGVIKEQSANTSAKFTFNNVPDGQYDVYVYTDSNNDNVALNIADNNYITTYYTIATHQFTNGASFIQAQNTNSAGPRDVGNYVKLSKVATYGSPTLGIVATYISGGDGLGIAGIQLVNVGGPVANTTPVSILTQPASQKFAAGDKLTFSVVKRGPGTFQWFKGTTAIAGATNDTYVTPALTAADDGAAFHVVVSNNVNSVPSADAVVTLSQITAPGFAKEERFDGVTARTDVEDPGFAAAPNVVRYLPSFEVPVNQANNFVERMSAIFTPAVSGNYVFFVCSDDDSDLFLSTDATPANKKLIAQETGWSTSRQWTASAGNSDLTSKRSDQFSSTEWGNTITLTAGTKYYIEGVHHEGGGGDNLAVTFILEGEADPANGSPSKLTGNLISTIAQDQGIKITITQQPASLTVQEQQRANFSVKATGTQSDGSTPTIYYQWQRKAPAAASFSDLPGETQTTYSTGLLSLSDTGTQFRVILVAPGVAVTSSVATVTVVTDNTPPQVVSVGSLKNFANNNTEVDVIFDEPLKDSANAVDLSHYTLNSGNITAARYVTNSSGLASRQSGVVLTATGLTAGNSYTLTVKGVSDQAGNTQSTPANIPFTAGKLTWISIGRTTELTPPSQPDALATGSNSFNLVSGGGNYWATDDDITMVYEEITGDFDKVAQVEYTDPASNWARSGISARESLNKGAPTTADTGDNPASRYQMIISDPTVKFDGTPGNNAYETNRRLGTGGATTAAAGGGNPVYPNSWVRIKRVGQLFEMFFGTDGMHWRPLAQTDFGDDTLSPEGPMPDKLFVGPTYGPENNNIADETLRKEWATRIRTYGDETPVQKARGQQTYGIGFNFGANEVGGPMSSNEVAGVAAVAQAHWNNLFGQSSTGPTTGIVADNQGAAEASTVTIEWDSNNTWESTGRGEENNQFTGPDHTLMTGYLDTGAATTSHAIIANIGSKLTSGGYDVYVYLLGGVDTDRGGGYRIVDPTGAVLKDYVLARCDANPTTFNQVPNNLAAGTYGVGNYIVFSGLKATAITVEATTDNGLGVGGTPRAAMNAVQLVAAGAVVAKPTISLVRKADGTGITLTFTGILQAADKVEGPYTDVAGATSPRDVLFSAANAKFYRTRNP